MTLLRRHVERLRFVAALALLGGCQSTGDVTIPLAPPRFDLQPASLTLHLGDTTSAAVVFADDTRRATFRWSSSDTAVVALDSTTASTSRVRMRAVGVGTGAVTVAVTVSGFTYMAAIPVTVSATVTALDPTPTLALRRRRGRR
jgi:hypothetical protein